MAILSPTSPSGRPVVASLRKATRLPLDCHLMIENPNEFIPAFADAGANWIGVHYEACPHLHRTIELIHNHGMNAGVVLNPATAGRCAARYPAHAAPCADHERESRLRRAEIHPFFAG
jgi:pentose-5-phosphate-3-epimerase